MVRGVRSLLPNLLHEESVRVGSIVRPPTRVQCVLCTQVAFLSRMVEASDNVFICKAEKSCRERAADMARILEKE